MSGSPSLTPPGGSSYSSDLLHVGDGTWDQGRDTFLLPNIEGLPFGEMRYNGMGNRFRSLPEYRSLITAHGIIAAITFIGIVPSAILIASYYHRRPFLALRIHIALQVLTVILTTVIFVLGYFAVGPNRSLTNPHHGIGLTIYLLILVQALGGWIIKRVERGKQRYYIPIKMMLHQWLGRGIALLALAQIAIGLTLYGSPVALFVLYALAMFALLVTYFILVHQNHKRVATGFDERESYISSSLSGATDPRHGGGPSTMQGAASDHHRRHRLEEMAGAVGLGAALTALRRRSSGRHRNVESGDDATSVTYSRPPPTEMSADGKFTESSYMSGPSRRPSWRDRLLGPAAGLGGLAAARHFLKRRKEKDDDMQNTGPYAAPASGPNRLNTMQERIRPMTPPEDDHWAQVEARERAEQAAMSRTDLHSRMSGDSYDSQYSPEKPSAMRRGRFGIPASLGALGGLGAIGGIGKFFKRRRGQTEEGRLDSEKFQDEDHDPMYGGGSAQRLYTGDGTPRRNRRVGSNSPQTEQYGSPTRNGPGVRSVGGASLLDESPDRSRRPSSIPPPPRSGSRPRPKRVQSRSPGDSAFTRNGSSQRDLEQGPQISQTSRTVSPPAAATAASGSLLSPPQGPRTQNRTHSNSPYDGVESPPVSVNVQYINDGTHVKFRRLNEEEAAESGDSGQPGHRHDSRHRRDRSAEDGEGANIGRFRRNGAGTPYAGRSPQVTPAQQSQPSDLHLPPGQHGGASSGPTPPSGIGSSPLSQPYQGTATDVSDFDSNRRRRRAERARAEEQRAAGRKGGARVEFS